LFDHDTLSGKDMMESNQVPTNKHKLVDKMNVLLSAL
jgi:hypothetical protein